MRPLQRPRLRSLPNAKGASFIISEYTLSSQTGNIRQQGVYVLVTGGPAGAEPHGSVLGVRLGGQGHGVLLAQGIVPAVGQDGELLVGGGIIVLTFSETEPAFKSIALSIELIRNPLSF